MKHTLRRFPPRIQSITNSKSTIRASSLKKDKEIYSLLLMYHKNKSRRIIILFVKRELQGSKNIEKIRSAYLIRRLN